MSENQITVQTIHIYIYKKKQQKGLSSIKKKKVIIVSERYILIAVFVLPAYCGDIKLVQVFHQVIFRVFWRFLDPSKQAELISLTKAYIYISI